MNASDNLRRLVETSYLTTDIEIDCRTCLDLVPIYVDMELAGEDAAREVPALTQHLAVCPDCQHGYEALRDIAALEATEGLPSVAELLEQLKRHER